MLLALVALVLTSACSAVASTYPTPRSTSVVFVPHADDDVLAFGGYIATQRAAGNEVYVVLYTDGAASGVCRADTMDGGTCTAGAWAGHSVAEFVAARDAEFRAAMTALHVPADHIVTEVRGGYVPRAHDSQTTLTYVRDVIRWWQQRVPAATFVTESWIDSHPDHRNGGLALRGLVGDGTIDPAQAAFAMSPWYWQVTTPAPNAHDYQAAQQLRTLYGKPDDAHTFTPPAGWADNAQAAVGAYDQVDGQPLSGIGHQSVAGYLDAWKADPASILHTYATTRYSTRIILTLSGSGTTRQASGGFRVLDYPGAATDRAHGTAVGLVQSLDGDGITNPGAGLPIVVTAYNAAGKALATTSVLIGTGGRWAGAASVPAGTTTVKALFAGSPGMGPATSDTTGTSATLRRK